MPRLMPEPAPLDFKARAIVFLIWLVALGTVACWLLMLWVLITAVWAWLS